MRVGGVVEEYGVYLSYGTLFGLVVAIVAGTLRAQRLERIARNGGHEPDRELRVFCERQIDMLKREMVRMERDNIVNLDIARREAGEMGLALRQKLHDVEIEARDRMAQFADKIEGKIDKAVDRLEEQIDRLAAGNKI